MYVGRPTRWGNPFSHQDVPGTVKVDTRVDAVEMYEHWIVTQPDLLRDLTELRGKDLVCWCAPSACHAEVLLKLANVDLESPGST